MPNFWKEMVYGAGYFGGMIGLMGAGFGMLGAVVPGARWKFADRKLSASENIFLTTSVGVLGGAVVGVVLGLSIFAGLIPLQ